MNAARAAPQAEEKLPLQKRLVTEGSNLALNVAAMGREAVEDFRHRDRFFKYKALIVAVWVGLSATSLGVACPGTGLKTTDLGAKVLLSPIAGRPSVTIRNMSGKPWLDVLFVVNRDWRASVARVEPQQDTTLTPKQLLGPGGKTAPADMAFVEMEMRTSDGKDVLIEQGAPRHQ